MTQHDKRRPIPSQILCGERVRETNRGEVNRQREDNKGHDPEDGLHGPQIGIVYTRFSPQLKTHLKWLQYLKNVAVIDMVHTNHG